MRIRVLTLRAGLLVVAGAAGLIAAIASTSRAEPAARESTASGTALETATFAGGCFWCMEPPFEKLEGVITVVAGYAGGDIEKPSYQDVSAGRTGHAEAVQLRYDPSRIGYERLLQVFWRQIDPTDPGGQFVDRGTQYRTAVFYHDEEQRRLAEQSKAALEQSGRYDRPLVTEILPFTKFHRAEEVHQDYYRKNPVRYRLYRYGSGRDRYLQRIWGSFTSGGSEPPGPP